MTHKPHPHDYIELYSPTTFTIIVESIPVDEKRPEVTEPRHLDRLTAATATAVPEFS